MAKGIGVTKKDVKAAARRRKRTPAMGVTPKDVKRMRKPQKKSPPLGVTPKDVKRMKRRRAAEKMADVEKGVTEDVKRGERIASMAESVAETGGLARAVQNLQKSAATKGWFRTPSPRDITKAEAITRGQKRAAKKRKEESITGGNRKGGTVSRRGGSKIMYGYKAGGKV